MSAEHARGPGELTPRPWRPKVGSGLERGPDTASRSKPGIAEEASVRGEDAPRPKRDLATQRLCRYPGPACRVSASKTGSRSQKGRASSWGISIPRMILKMATAPRRAAVASRTASGASGVTAQALAGDRLLLFGRCLVRVRRCVPMAMGCWR